MNKASPEAFVADLILLMKKCGVEKIEALNDNFVITSKGYGKFESGIITYYKEDENHVERY